MERTVRDISLTVGQAKPGVNLVELDWPSYFRLFDQTHEGSPVNYGGRLLYRDGWQYSGLRYEGPEWPPPDDVHKLKALQIVYWRLHRNSLRQRRHLLQQQLTYLTELQSHKSLPLQRKVTSLQEDEVSGTVMKVDRVVDVELEALQPELDWLNQSIAECERQLEGLNK